MWLPAGMLLTDSLVAEPSTIVTAEPMGTPSTSNSMVPTGVWSCVSNGLTMAVKVMAWP